MKKTFIIITSLAAIALAAGTGFAWGPGAGRSAAGYGSDWNCPGYGRQAAFNDLSRDQRNQLQALRQKFIDDTYELRSARFARQQEIRMLMQTSSPDKTRLGKLSSEINDLQKQIMDKRIEFILAAKKIAPEFTMGPGMGYGRGIRRHAGMGGTGMMNGFYGRRGGCRYTD
jgi:zinc resistance-associated protein